MCNCINLNNHQSHINTRMTFSMRLKLHQSQQESGVCTCVAFVFQDSLVLRLCRKGFLDEVADWLRVQESLKWALAGFAESWALSSLANATLAPRTQRKENKLSQRIKGCKRLGGFSSHHGSNWLGVVQSTWREREFIFPERERERNPRGRSIQEREQKLRERS